MLDLPRGFACRVLTRTGERMDDGLPVPGAPDGMAAFPGPNGRVRLVRNHELHHRHEQVGPFADGFGAVDPSRVYDPGFFERPAQGGTTTLDYDPESGRIERQFLSLAGTVRNCAGGPTPWGSWISCEESVDRAGGYVERDHGFCFEVPARAAGLVEPVPLVAMGRFNHEALAVDPRTGIVYLTEDRPDGLFYRFLPDAPGELARGGRLQALRIADGRSDTRNWDAAEVRPRERLAAEWTDLADPEAPDDDLRLRGHEAGAALFARGEGAWWAGTGLYFTCTRGGANQRGQVFRYTPSEREGRPQEGDAPGTLELFSEPNDTSLLESPDNLTVSRRGELYVCEDGPFGDRVVRIDRRGELSLFASNALNYSELTGPVFAPDGRTLFVNVQRPGLLLAITGPF